MHWRNTVEGYCDWIGEELCEKIADYLQENTEWVQRKIHQHRRGKSSSSTSSEEHKGNKQEEIYKNGNPYWHHVSLFYEQLQGLEDGYDFKVRFQRIYTFHILN